MTRENLNGLLLSSGDPRDEPQSGVEIDGRREALQQFFGLLDDFDPWFNIVEP